MNQQEAVEVAKLIPWARFVGQNDRNEWWAFEFQPREAGAGWYPHGGRTHLLGFGGLELLPCVEIKK